MNKSVQIAIAVAVLLALFLALAYKETKAPIIDITEQGPFITEDVIIEAPAENSYVNSPLTVKGKARGTWFFEASFPIKVTGIDGLVFGQSHVQAQGEWMTPEFVPFEGTINFTVPAGVTEGFLVLEKDNPSGLPENDKSVKMKVRFLNNMKITSPNFNHNETIPAKYTCDGVSISPHLSISETPSGTESLAIIMDDPDAPSGTWVHWTVWNIPPETAEIEEDQIPDAAVEGMTSFNEQGYGGPCPPSGEHRYFFKLYALNVKLDLSPTASAEDLEHAMEEHILAEAELMGRFERR